MKLKVQCPNCQTVHQVPASLAGKRCKCTTCQSVVSVPAQQTQAGKLRIQCRKCQTVHTVPESMRGKRCKCSSCQAVVNVPAAPSQPAPPDDPFGFPADGVSDDLFGELGDATFNAEDFSQAAPPVRPPSTPSFAEEPKRYTEEDVSHDLTWEDRIYYQSNVFGLPMLRWIEICVIGFSTIAMPAFSCLGAAAKNPWAGALLVGLVTWVIMLVFYSASFSSNTYFGRGVIGLIILIVTYEGPWTFYLWVFLYPAYVAATCFIVHAVFSGLALAG